MTIPVLILVLKKLVKKVKNELPPVDLFLKFSQIYGIRAKTLNTILLEATSFQALSGSTPSENRQ
jgi:hypothetical protein